MSTQPKKILSLDEILELVPKAYQTIIEESIIEYGNNKYYDGYNVGYDEGYNVGCQSNE